MIKPTLILLYPSPEAQSWIAEEYVNGLPNPTLVDLFGTHALPTAFGAEASWSMVRAEIGALNPSAVVTLKFPNAQA